MKRLERVLNNEDYGPKLARMNRADERRILDMIDRNVHYTKVHKEIDRLDEARRTKQRVRRTRVKRPVVKSIEQMRRDAFLHMNAQLRNKWKYKEETNRKYVNVMDKQDLDRAMTASKRELEDLGRAPAYVDLGDIEINPFWYH